MAPGIGYSVLCNLCSMYRSDNDEQQGILYLKFLLLLLLLECVSVHACQLWHVCGSEKTLLTLGLVVELKSGLCGKHFYLSGHLASYKGKLYRVRIMSVVIGS